MRSYERYGMQRHEFYIYEYQGKTWLKRTQGFTGALEIVVDEEGIARNARNVTIPLTNSQLKTIRQQLTEGHFSSLYEAYKAEQTAYLKALKEATDAFNNRQRKIVVTAKGDTLYTLSERKQERRDNYYPPAQWQQDICWEGVASNMHSYGKYSYLDRDSTNWTIGHPARDKYLEALNDFHTTLDDMVYRYKQKHPYQDEFYTYNYYINGGMMLRRNADGQTVRAGSGIQLTQRKGQWYVYGYVEEQEDTALVEPEVAQRVLDKVLKLNTEAMNPKLKAGEKLLKSEVSDDAFFSMTALFHTRERIVVEDGRRSNIIEPKWAAKQYLKLKKDIDAINDYLWNFLKLKNDTQISYKRPQ